MLQKIDDYIQIPINSLLVGGNVPCEVGTTFLYTTYCCQNSNGATDCCKNVRWEPITFTIIGCVAVVIILSIICCCCCNCCKGLVDCLCCCCRNSK
ncbi:hypothetical protein EG68_06711 [Paragonimus skrjabini miyazakii]|uniref:Uncharacterized protein n=1 Tax=Paragonimus skrjabini miyazakii TaxID=59628 RepID=A0A8S9YW40_9TREM|nr:hypothetical protein EG68_06711 [Paragonimus skrjabini miyazakii]